MEKTLILTYDKNAYFYPFVKNKNISIEEPIKKKNIINKIFFRIPILSTLSYGFLPILDEIDKIIIFDSVYNFALGFYLKKIKKIEKVYLYCWNPINKMHPRIGKIKIALAKKMMKIFSFDHNDCKEFDLYYAPMVYSKNVAQFFDKEEIRYDLFFMGGKKDRYELLKKIYNTYFKGKYKSNIILVGEEENNRDFTFSKETYGYSEYLRYVSQSKAILDIPQVGQEGLTIRNVESIFLKKKLLTTKRDIIKYDFYNSNNIFILGKDDSNRLAEFFSSKYEDIDEQIKDNYEIEKWIKLIK